MQIVEKKITDIKPYKYNPRKNDKAVDAVANSIKEFGFKVPIIIDKNGEIVAGHTRYKASKKLGLEVVPCIIADDLSEEQIKAFRLADNKVGELAEWDDNLLKIELDGILDIDMTDFGFKIPENEDEIIEDEIPELPEEPKSKLGDIYQLGRHFLMCGDSTDEKMVDALVAGRTVDMVFTDPPYGVSYVGTNNPNGREWEMIEGDDLRGDALVEFLTKAFKNIKKNLKLGGAFYIWYANSNAVQFEKALEEADLRKKQIIIWSKGMVLGHSDYHWTYEPCLYGCHPEENCKWYGDRAQKTLWDLTPKEIHEMKKTEMEALLERLYKDKDIWEISRDPVKQYIHPTQKPVALSAKAIHNSTEKGMTVLDLFGGSGSTLMGCEQTGRNALLMEYDPKYVDLIIERWERFTGNKAIKIQ